MDQLPLLSLTIWVPIAFGILTLISARVRRLDVRWVALVGSIVTLLISLPLYTAFDASSASMQFVEKAAWIPQFNAHYFLGVDGISMPLILLTNFMTILVVIAGWKVITYKRAQYLAAFLLMAGFMNGVFAALDGLLFYVFWEAQLIPMFIIIGVWGGPRRIYATFKFFLYTFLGSMLMLVALVYLYLHTGSFNILVFQHSPLTMTAQVLIFLAFLVAFAVKIPMWPVHTWLPDAHVEAPTGGSVILAAIMLKLGAYGLLRFSLPIAPDASQQLQWLMIVLSLIAIIYIGLVAIVQKDMKKLVAYSSVAHMGFVTLGIFIVFMIVESSKTVAGAAMGVDGAVVQMISHGLISGAMFLCVGVLYDRMHTREMAAYGGVANKMPAFAFFFVLFAMANCGLPGTSGFVGEFMVIIASFKANFWVALCAAIALILGASYSLALLKKVLWGPVANDNVAALKDLEVREFIVLGLLAVGVIALGVYPQPLIKVMEPSVQQLVHHVLQSKLPL